MPYIFDLELCGKCNTVCSFCPRHEMARGEDYMSHENFEHFLGHLKSYAQWMEGRELIFPFERARLQNGHGVGSAVRVLLCGMGESIMHPRCAEYVGRMRNEAGCRVTLVTNGLALNERRTKALFEAGITVIVISVPGINAAQYEKYMELKWDRVFPNIVNAHKTLGERLLINAVIPDDADWSEADAIKFWGGLGIPLAGLNHCHNRGGFLTDSHLTGKLQVPSERFCGIFARHNFIAWDGRVLACCHDLHAEGVLGHVSEDDFFTIARRKAPGIANGPDYSICAVCNDHERCQAGSVLNVAETEMPQPMADIEASIPLNSGRYKLKVLS